MAVFSSVGVAGLIKPAQCPNTGQETRLGANPGKQGRIRTSVSTSLSGEGSRKKSQGFKPYLVNPAVRDYRGASGNVARVEL